MDKIEISPLLYVYGYKATRVERWRNLQPYVGDCKEGLIPLRYTNIIDELNNSYEKYLINVRKK